LRVDDVKVAVLLIEGTNCEDESRRCFASLGARAEKVHLKQLVDPSVGAEDRRFLEDYDVLMIPGGFSSGDYVRAGAIFAARMKSTLAKDLTAFVEAGKPVLGVCNGFQVLVELGLLPALDGVMSPIPQAVLATNDSARYECRPTLLRHENGGSCVFTRGLGVGQVIQAPSAHTEGKLTLPGDRQDAVLERLIENDQVVFRYVDDTGEYAGYPWNPNGSIDNIGGLCNPAGNVLGMMPHPERSFHRYLHPDWTRSSVGEESGDGRVIFESVLDYVCARA
jgi:phosphoribosylformylglycinamidine synthase